VILVGQLRLGQHQTLDEVHQELSRRLQPFAPLVSRAGKCSPSLMPIAPCCGQEQPEPPIINGDCSVEENGGLIISIDGIQPDSGNETIYAGRATC
jgi:hypothetical protein